MGSDISPSHDSGLADPIKYIYSDAHRHIAAKCVPSDKQPFNEFILLPRYLINHQMRDSSEKGSSLFP